MKWYMILCVLSSILPTPQVNRSQYLPFSFIHYEMNLLYFSVFFLFPEAHDQIQIFIVQMHVSIFFIKLFFKFPIDK